MRGTLWKRSVAAFQLHGAERCLALAEDLASGSYRPREPIRFWVTRPKRRRCCSIGIRDRVYQRSLNDNVVYPAMVRSLIPENCACQEGKGTDRARDLLALHLRRFHARHGTDGWALLMDIKGYYPNMRHDVALEGFERRLDPVAYSHVERILSSQYSGDVGFEAGSQLVQIAGVSALDGLDHCVKERLGIRHYIRYMDDMVVLCGSRERLEEVREECAAWLAERGMALNRQKTHIQPIGRRIPWLGFTFELRPTGYVLRRVKPAKARDVRRRLARIARAVDAGRLELDKADEMAANIINYLRRNCSGRGAPRKAEKHWQTLTEGARHGSQQGR